jgi:hypothetical protein
VHAKVSFRVDCANAFVLVDVNANVAIDMFMDSNRGDSATPALSSHEVMVWLAMYGPATQPIGFNLGSKQTQSINGTTL